MITAIASEQAKEAMSCATYTRGGCYVMCLDGRTCFIANNVLYYNIVLHCEVAEDADMAELADRAIRLIISMTINFIIISPLPRVHFCLGKVWRNPNMKLSCCTLNIGRVEVEQNGEAVPTSGGRPRSGLDPLVIY